MRWLRWLRWLGVAAAVVVALLGAAAAYVATLDLNSYKGDVQAALEEFSGRRVEIAGSLDLAWTPRPTLTVSGVRVANAEWGSEQAMATVGDLAVGVELLPLLTGRANVIGLRLSDVRLLLERDAAGRGNWQFGNLPGDGARAGSGTVPEIQEAELERISLIWKAGPKAVERIYRIDRLSLADAGQANRLDVTLAAVLDGDAVALTGTLPDLASLRRPGAELPIDLKGRLAGTEFALTAAFRVEWGDVAVDRVRAERLDVSFGELSATGSASADLTGSRPRVEARLQTGTVDLDHIVRGASDGSADGLDRVLRLDQLTLADGRLDVTIARLVAAGVAVDGLTATAKLSDGTLTIDPVVGKLAEGPLTGRLVLDRKGEGPARLTVTAAASGMDMGTVYRALLGEALIEGRGDAALDLRGGGDTPRALLGSSQGVARLVVQDGVIMNRYWELIAEDVATRFLPFVNDADRGRLNCLVGRFDIAGGIADATVLMVDSERVTVGGEGTIDLAAQTLDMRLVPQPKDPSLFSLATPILLTGPLADPRPAPDPVAIAKGLGGIAAGTALGPLGLLLPFVSSGSADRPCPEAIAAAEAKHAPGASKSGNEQGNPGSIKGLFESLRKAIE